MSRLWLNEWIAGGFFLYLAILASVRRLGARRRTRVQVAAAVSIAITLALASVPPSPALSIVRKWIPVAFLLQAYWLCGLFFRQPMPRVEQALLAVDRVVFRMSGLQAMLDRGPRAVLEYFELTYLTVYPFIPMAFGLFCWLGFSDEAERFWTGVLFSGLAAYGTLPWIQTRPPRTLEPSPPRHVQGLIFRRLNYQVLNHASVQVNTFPSGHASTAIAAALAILSVHLPWGLAVLGWAISITVATVLGRYHFAIDSVLGVGLGILGWWIGFRGHS